MTARDPGARRPWLGLAVLALPTLLVTMDLSVLFLAVPALSRDLEPTSSELLWITDIYGFLIAGSLIAMGTLGDRIGRRRLLMIGGAAFALASLAAAFSQSAAMLIASRALLGIAGATLAPSSLSLIRDLFADERQRGLAIGIWMSCFAAGAAIGPVVGGALLEGFWWGSVFLINVPVMALMLVLAPRLLPESRNPAPGPFDLAAAASCVIAVLLLVYAIKRSAEQGIDGAVAASAFAGLAVAVAFGARERRARAPMIDLRLFRAAGFATSLAAMGLAAFAMAGILLFVAQYLQLVRGMEPLEAGLWSVPAMLGTIAGSVLAPAAAARFGATTVLPACLALGAGGLAVLATLEGDSALAVLVAGSVLLGAGAGAVGTVGTSVVLASVAPERAGAASGLSETASELGGSLGIAVLGSIGAAVYRERAGEAIAADAGSAAAARETLASAVAAGAELPASALAAAEAAFVDGLRIAAVTGTVLLAALAAAAVAVLRRAGPVIEPG